MRPQILAAFLLIIPLQAAKRPIEPLNLLKLDTLSSRVVSPNGEWVAFLISKLNWAKGIEQADIFVVKTDGTNRRQMTFTEEDSETLLTWARDSQSIFLLSPRGGKRNQLYRLPLHGGEAQKLSDESNGVTSFAVGRAGRWLVYRAGAGPNRLQPLRETAFEPPQQAATRPGESD